MVKYTRLWETMQRKGISQYRLIKTYGISNGQLNRLRKNLYISTHTVETLCRILFSIVLGAAILGEPVKSTSILGGALVAIASIMVYIYGNSKKQTGK